MGRVRLHAWILIPVPLLVASLWLVPAPLQTAPPRMITVPALLVGIDHGQPVGVLHYIVLQIDHDPARTGPTVLFNETQIGSAVDAEWKAGVRTAVEAAAATLGEDARAWRVIVMNRSPVSFTQGSSASAAVAVALMAAWKRDTLREDTILTGVITATGAIREVDGLPSKLAGAADNGKTILLIPRGQARTQDWDLIRLGVERRVTVIEVATLLEAYAFMTGKQSAN